MACLHVIEIDHEPRQTTPTFLPDGTPSGPRYYELVNWTGQALVMPVNRIKELVSGAWLEFERPGVYLVRGESEEGHSRLYIGESENVAKRVQGHPSQLTAENTKSTKNIRIHPFAISVFSAVHHT